jgi:hypothetical protein
MPEVRGETDMQKMAGRVRHLCISSVRAFCNGSSDRCKVSRAYSHRQLPILHMKIGSNFKINETPWILYRREPINRNAIDFRVYMNLLFENI